jgi:hypothetical protein
MGERNRPVNSSIARNEVIAVHGFKLPEATAISHTTDHGNHLVFA